MKASLRGWVAVASAFTLMFVGFGAAYSFGAFFKAFQSEFGASRGHVSLVFSVAAFVWFVSGAPAGMLADRFGPRRVTLCGVLLLAGALWLASAAASVGMLYATYSLGVGIGVGLMYVPSVGAVQPWFTTRRGLASGLAVAGIGAGNFGVPLLTARWIDAFGWRGAFVALALFALVLGGAAALAIASPAHSHASPREGTALGAALRTPQFALLYVSMVLGCVGVFVPMVHIGPFAQDLGYSEAQGVALVSLIGLGSLVGRFTLGPLADRFGRRVSAAAMYAGLGALLLVWWGASAYWLLAAFAVLFGMCYGGFVALMPTIVMELYGARAVSGIIGFLYTGAGVGTLIGPWMAGAAFDLLGSYQIPILASAALSFGAAICIVILIRNEKPQILHRG